MLSALPLGSSVQTEPRTSPNQSQSKNDPTALHRPASQTSLLGQLPVWQAPPQPSPAPQALLAHLGLQHDFTQPGLRTVPLHHRVLHKVVASFVTTVLHPPEDCSRALVKSAPRKSAVRSCDEARFSPHRLAPASSVPVSVELLRLAPDRSAPSQTVPRSDEPCRSTPDRSSR